MIDSSTERSPGCLAPYQLRNIFLKYLIIISVIGIYKNGIIFKIYKGVCITDLTDPWKACISFLSSLS